MTSFWDYQEKLRRPAPVAGQPLTVSQLTAQIDRALKAGLPGVVSVRGEVSNFNHHRASGHCYFTLKDAAACIDCVVFRDDFRAVKFRPEDGMELLAGGRVAVFAQRGRYQLYVSRLEPLGQGALELARKQLQAKLAAEGLFDPQRRKPLPLYPLRLALVTSLHTAALQDMLKVLRRFPWLRLYVYHVPVQGPGSAVRIAEALAELGRCAAATGAIDLILLGRGGGSLEDLWEFNEEVLVRAMVRCPIPIVTGIGHEVDVALADLAADHHAHTPTEAAVVATSAWRGAPQLLEERGLRLRREMGLRLHQLRQRLGHLERHEVFSRPLHRVNNLRQLLDHRERALRLALAGRAQQLGGRLHQLLVRLEQQRPAAVLHRLRERLGQMQQRLGRAAGGQLRARRDRLAALAGALGERHPRHTIRLHRQRLESVGQQLSRAMLALLQRRTGHLTALAQHLNAVGPQQVLRRGYSITTLKKSGTVIRSANDLKTGDRILTRLADGAVESTVEDSRQLRLFE
jgi:exodeoxyribonuclease VII large subunit